MTGKADGTKEEGRGKGPRVHLEELEIHRMPGFPPKRAFTLEGLSPGINVVHGPNASGKTTVAQAISLAVHGEADVEGHPSLRAHLRTSEGPREVRVEAGQRSLAGEDGASAAAIGSGAAADRYQLFLHELIQAEDPNRDLAEWILKESQGGYDVTQARDELFREGPSSAQISQRRAYNDARDRLRTVESDVIDPTETEHTLDELEREREQLRRAKQRAAALEQARDYREHRSTLETARARLAELPDALDEVTGEEPDRLDELEDQRDEAEGKLSDARRRIDRARDEIAEADLPEEGVPDELVPTLRKRVQKLQGLENRIEELEQKEQKADAEARQARDALGEITDPDALEDVDTELVQRADELAQETETVREKQAVLQAVDEWLEDDDETPDAEAVAAGVRALRGWLQQPAGAVSEEASTRGLALAASGLTILAGLGGVGLFALGQATVLAAGGGALLVVAGLVLAFLSLRSEASQSSDEGAQARRTYRREFERLALEAPRSWQPDPVHERLDEIHEALVEIQLAREREQQRLKLAPDREKLEGQVEELDRRARGLVDELGVELELGERSFLWFVRNLADWQAARTEQAGAQRQLETAREQSTKLLTRVGADLEPYGYDEPADAAAALSQIEDLDDRVGTFEAAHGALDQATADAEEAETQLEAKEEAIEELFTALDLEPGDEAGLRQLCDKLDDHRKAQAAKAEAKPLCAEALEKLRAEPGYEEAMQELTETEIETELERLEGSLDRLVTLQEEIPRLEERIRAAKQEERVEAAIAERDEALAALRDKMEEETAQVVGWAVAEHVHELTRDRDRPPVFHRASELLTEITNGRYELQFSDGDPPEFQARDTWYDETRTLDELSSGTRVQLMLAVRLAFVEHQETGAKLPLVLDETLANTDDVRARAIIDAIVQIARDGRQVFYLTAQDDEVAKWAGAFADGDDALPDHAIVDLAEVRSLSEHEQAPAVEPAPVSVAQVPEPGDRDHAAYVELISVPPFDPRESLGALHVWYLVHDTELLHRLLELGIQRWGELETLYERTDQLATIVPEDRWEAVRARAKALSAYRSAWETGRGEPVDRAVLDAAPGVTDNKIDEVAQVAEKVDGDPSRLLAALDEGAVAYFRASQHDKLEAFLQREGYVDERDALSPEAIQQRVLTSVSTEIDEGALDREEVLELLRLVTDPPASVSKEG